MSWSHCRRDSRALFHTPAPQAFSSVLAEPDCPFPSEQRPFRAENFDQLVLVINACSYDEALLSGCLHPPRLRLLASRDGLLHVDSAQRATLALVQAELAAVQASMARAKQEQPEATPLVAESSDTDDGGMTAIDDMLAAAESAVAEMQEEVAMGAEAREAAQKENVADEKPPSLESSPRSRRHTFDGPLPSGRDSPHSVFQAARRLRTGRPDSLPAEALRTASPCTMSPPSPRSFSHGTMLPPLPVLRHRQASS